MIGGRRHSEVVRAKWNGGQVIASRFFKRWRDASAVEIEICQLRVVTQCGKGHVGASGDPAGA